MFRLVVIGHAAISSLFGAAVALTACSVLVAPVQAAQPVVQAQLSFTCEFNTGPRTGQRQSYAGFAGIEAAPVGTFCADGQGSTGTVVPDAPVQMSAPVQPPAIAVAPVSAARATTFSCRFDHGPRAGQIQSYAGVTGMEPIPVGAPCADGQGSTGVAIAETPPPPPPPTTSSTCQFNSGPRAGQVQSYAGVTGMRPMRIGSPCADGQGSSGVAVPDPSVPAVVTPVPIAVPVVAPPAAAPPPVPSVAPPPPSVSTGSAAGAPSRRGTDNTDQVAYISYTGRHRAGAAPRHVVSEAAAQGIAQGPAVITGAAVGAAVRGMRGAIWADPNNIGYATGYTYNGRYYPGLPPEYGESPAPPPPSPAANTAPTVRSEGWSGERG